MTSRNTRLRSEALFCSVNKQFIFTHRSLAPRLDGRVPPQKKNKISVALEINTRSVPFCSSHRISQEAQNFNISITECYRTGPPLTN
jgi:hypothetical protein